MLVHGSKSTTMPHAVAVTSDDYNLRLPRETRRRCSTCILGGRTEREGRIWNASREGQCKRLQVAGRGETNALLLF